MGLLDRDYMHDRHRKERRNSPPPLRPNRAVSVKSSKKRIVWWALLACSLAYLVFKYLVLPAGAVPFPAPSQALWFVPQDMKTGAPLTVTAPSRGDTFYAVRVQELGTGRVIVVIPLRKGETVKVHVPLGQYEMVFASGSYWHGPEKLFGFSGEKKKAVKTFDFYRSGNQTTGHAIDLTNRIDGNLQTREITPFEK